MSKKDSEIIELTDEQVQDVAGGTSGSGSVQMGGQEVGGSLLGGSGLCTSSGGSVGLSGMVDDGRTGVLVGHAGSFGVVSPEELGGSAVVAGGRPVGSAGQEGLGGGLGGSEGPAQGQVGFGGAGGGLGGSAGFGGTGGGLGGSAGFGGTGGGMGGSAGFGGLGGDPRGSADSIGGSQYAPPAGAADQQPAQAEAQSEAVPTQP